MKEEPNLWIEAVVQSSDDAIISKDLNNIIVSWNKGAEKLYGYTPQETIGQPISIIIPEDKIGDVPMTAELIESRKYIHHLETVRIAKDGTRIDVSVSVSPVINSKGVLIGSSAIARDITERHKNEQALHMSEERYRKIVELSPDAMFIHSDGEIIFVNPAALKLFGAQDENELIGMSIWKLYTTDRHGLIRARIQTMKTTQQAAPFIEHTVLKLDHTLLNVEESACQINYANQSAIYVIMRDITERKKNRMLLNMQYAVANSMTQSINLADETTNILKIACNSLGLDVGKVWGLNKVENTLYPIASYSEAIIPFRSANDLAKKVLDTEDTCWVEDVTQLVNSTYPEDYEFKLGIGIPILNEKEIIGVLEFTNAKLLAKDEAIIQALVSVANQLGLFIKRKIFEKDLVYISKHDATTGLFNRFFFEEILTFEIYRAKNKDKRLAILFLDIENFRNINQSMGHQAGDALLKELADQLTTLVPTSDYLARFGTDKFVIIIDEFNKTEEIAEFINKINSTIADAFTIQGQKININLNIGISRYPEDGDNAQALIRGADIALTKAKKSGQGSFEFCSNNITSIAKKRISIEAELHEALVNQEFVLYYQPIVEMPSLTINGFEALIRWNKNGKIISPGEFVPIMEQTPLIIPIGEWILRTACIQGKIWQQTMGRPIIVSVNISPLQFRDLNILDKIANILSETGLEPSCLKIEITESAIMSDISKSVKILHKLKELGIKLAIDDFGTGYSSLSYLTQMPIDYLKIDQSFVKNMIVNYNDAAIIKTIVALASNLGYQLIAEGIETEEQLKFINDLGCFEIQGYYFGRPMPQAEATEFLRIGCN